MGLLRRIARPLVASIYVVNGFGTARNPERVAERAEPMVRRIAPALPEPLPHDTLTLVRFNGGVQVAAGSALALSKAPRLASAVLAASLVPTTLAGHAFWAETDKAARMAQRTQFLKNLSMLGGLLIAVADTGGKPSLGWRARAGARRSAARAQSALRATSARAHDAAESVRDVIPD